MMSENEAISYTRSLFSDLQEAWECLEKETKEISIYDVKQRLKFHIEAGMSWDSVRNLKQMRVAISQIIAIIEQARLGELLTEYAGGIWSILEEILQEIGQ